MSKYNHNEQTIAATEYLEAIASIARANQRNEKVSDYDRRLAAQSEVTITELCGEVIMDQNRKAAVAMVAGMYECNLLDAEELTWVACDGTTNYLAEAKERRAKAKATGIPSGWKSLEHESFGFTHPELVGRYTREQMVSIAALIG